MALIAFAIVLVPMLTNKLISILTQSSKYARQVYHVKSTSSHVVICGDLRSCSLQEFFAELFHEDHENTNLTGVILQPYPPTFEMLAVLDKPEWSLMILEGSPLVEKDLKRAAADTALAVFILANKFSISQMKRTPYYFAAKYYQILHHEVWAGHWMDTIFLQTDH